MPAPRKIDLIPAEIRQRLQKTLKERGFSGYEAVTEDLNFWLEEAGLELRIGKTAVHAYGAEFREYARMQEAAQDEIKAFMAELDAAGEVDVTSALFQQLTIIQWRLQMALSSPDALPDPRGMKDLTTALNNLIRSTELRDKIAAGLRRQQAEALDAAEAAGDIDQAAAEAARRIMGFA